MFLLTSYQLTPTPPPFLQYGFAVFRRTGLTDASHVSFSRRFGDLDNISRYITPGRKLRYSHLELFDASNLDGDGAVVPRDSPRAHYNRGNALFHTDSSFNPRRASFSLLRAVEVPPPGQGGETEFADSRAAWDDLDEETRALLLPAQGAGAGGCLVGAYGISHSRKMGSPEFFRDLDVDAAPMSLHRLAQPHEPSGRTNLYVGAHLHHVEGLPPGAGRAGSDALVRRLNAHVARPGNVASVAWEAPGDMVAWDNRAVLHRATGGAFEDRWRRDMRRTTVHDDGAFAWGLNRVGETMPGFDSYTKPGEKPTF